MEQEKILPQYLLAINTSEGHLQLAVGRSTETSAYELICSQEWRVVSQGAEMLIPLLASTCERLHIKLRDISKVACVSGPGSFTGVRLAVSTIAGLVRAREGKLLQGAMSLMPLLAKGVWEKLPWLLDSPWEKKPTTVWVITHARRNLVHMQGFDAKELSQSSLKSKTDVLVVSPDEVAALLLSLDEKAIIVGSGVTKNRQILTCLLPEALLLPDSYASVDPYVLITSASQCSFSLTDIAPAYIRVSDAEEGLESIATSLGIDPKEAQMALARLTTSFEQP